jgi:hypothetical protein
MGPEDLCSGWAGVPDSGWSKSNPCYHRWPRMPRHKDHPLQSCFLLSPLLLLGFFLFFFFNSSRLQVSHVCHISVFNFPFFYGDTDINGELPDPGKLVLFSVYFPQDIVFSVKWPYPLILSFGKTGVLRPLTLGNWLGLIVRVTIFMFDGQIPEGPHEMAFFPAGENGTMYSVLCMISSSNTSPLLGKTWQPLWKTLKLNLYTVYHTYRVDSYPLKKVYNMTPTLEEVGSD